MDPCKDFYLVLVCHVTIKPSVLIILVAITVHATWATKEMVATSILYGICKKGAKRNHGPNNHNKGNGYFCNDVDECDPYRFVGDGCDLG